MYGSGYSGLNSYGGLSSYGGMSSPYSRSYGTTQNLQHQNNPNNQQDPQKDSRKAFFEELFKMMGGLRSVIQIGFAAIAIANFYTHASAMTKKLVAVVKTMLGGLLKFMHKQFTKKMLLTLADSDSRKKALKTFLINFVRVFSVVLLCLSAKMKSQIHRESQQRLQKLEQEYQKQKNGQIDPIQVEQQEQQEALRLQQTDLVLQNANL